MADDVGDPQPVTLTARIRRLLRGAVGEPRRSGSGRPRMLSDQLPPGSCARTGTPPDFSDFFAPDEPPDDWEKR